MLKDSASKQKIQWLYINRICLCVITFFVSLWFFNQLHKIAVDYIYTTPTTDNNILGQMSGSDQKKAMELTKQDNYFLDRFKSNINVTEQQLSKAIANSNYYKEATEEEIQTATKRIYGKLQVIQTENMQWFELLLSIAFSAIAYEAPVWILIFQRKMRALEM